MRIGDHAREGGVGVAGLRVEDASADRREAHPVVSLHVDPGGPAGVGLRLVPRHDRLIHQIGGEAQPEGVGPPAHLGGGVEAVDQHLPARAGPAAHEDVGGGAAGVAKAQQDPAGGVGRQLGIEGARVLEVGLHRAAAEGLPARAAPAAQGDLARLLPRHHGGVGLVEGQRRRQRGQIPGAVAQPLP